MKKNLITIKLNELELRLKKYISKKLEIEETHSSFILLICFIILINSALIYLNIFTNILFFVSIIVVLTIGFLINKETKTRKINQIVNKYEKTKTISKKLPKEILEAANKEFLIRKYFRKWMTLSTKNKEKYIYINLTKINKLGQRDFLEKLFKGKQLEKFLFQKWNSEFKYREEKLKKKRS